MLAESSNETSLFLDKSSRISKPPLGQLIFEELLTPEGEGLAKICWRGTEGKRLMLGFAPQWHQGDLKLQSQEFLSMDWDLSSKKRGVDTL